LKKFILLCIVAVLLVALSGCLMVGLNQTSGVTVQGTGAMVSRDFDINDFNGLYISGAFVVVYRNSATYAVTVEMQENLFEYLNVDINRQTLQIEASANFRTTRNNTPRVYIYAPYLSSVSLHAAITTENWDTIYAENFSIDVSGASTATISMEVEKLEINVSGAASFDLSGSARDANITVSGAGDVNARQLQTRDARIQVNGASTVELAVSDNLDVSIAGVGTVRYVGNPQVSQSIAGLGSVRQVD